MSDRLEIKITATDSASKVFGQVGTAAGKMGKSIDDAGKSFDGMGESAADIQADIDRLKANMDEAGESSVDLGNAARDVGVALGVLGGAMILSGAAARDQEVAIRNLERSYGDASGEMQAFAEQIQDTTNFSNDQAVASANLAATLARNYGFTADEIQRVLQISADLAASTGFSMEEATQRVTAALRGEAESAEALGLTMNQMAIDREGLTLTMSNQEAGHFRLNALIEQSAFATGAAAEQADTAYGSFTNLKDSVQDAAQSFGNFLGPVGELGAFIADNAIQSALAAAGLVKLGQGALAARTGLMALTGTSTGLAALSSVLIGPAGIVVAVGLAAVAISQFTDDAGVDFHQVSESAIADIDALIAKVVELGDTSALGSLILTTDTLAASLEKQNSEFNDALSIIPGWITDVRTLNDANEETIEGIDRETLAMDGLSESVLDMIDANADGILTAKELEAGLGAVEEAAADTQRVIDGLAAGADEMATIFTLTGKGADEAKAAALAYTEALLNHGLSQEDYENGLQQVVATYGDVQEETLAAEAATNALSGTVKLATADLLAMADALSSSLAAASRQGGAFGAMTPFELWESQLTDADQAALDLADTLSTTLAAAARSGGTQGMLSPFELWESQLTAADQAALDLADTLSSTLAAAGSGQMGLAGLDDILVEQAGVALAAAMDQVTGAFTATTSAMESGFRVIVGNTNAIADQSQAVDDWAHELRTLGEDHRSLNTLLAEGAISQTSYNDAVSASIEINRANESIQGNILEIQAEQAPILGELATRQAEYIQSVADMEAPQQAIALAYMDTATAAEALSLAQIAASEAPGFEGLIQGAIAANSHIETLLTDMGVVSRGADGELIIHTTGETELESLTSAIEALNTTFTTLLTVEVDDSALANIGAAQGFPMGGDTGGGASTGGLNMVVMITADNTDANAKIDDTTGKLSTWDGASGTGDVLAVNDEALARVSEAASALSDWDSSSGNAAIEASDNASGKINDVSRLLAGLDGDSATVYLNTVNTTTYQTVGTPGGMFFGLGGVASYAQGGVTARMGEYGDEMLHFPNGGVAMTRGDGLYTVPQGTYVDTAPATKRKIGAGAGTVVLNIENLYGDDTLAERVSRQIVPAIQRAMAMHQRGY